MNIEMSPEITENNTQEQPETVVTVSAKTHRLSSIIPIIIFSFFGTLIRLSLNFLGNNQTPLSAGFWSNFFGCFIMGFIVEQKVFIQTHFYQLYSGLTTGLCGSITTFSGVMYNSCLALFGPSSHQIYPASNYLSVIVSIFSSSYMGFLFGRHLSIALLSCSSSSSSSTTTTTTAAASQTRRNHQCLNKTFIMFLFPSLIITSFLVLILLALLLPTGPYTYFIYSLIMAPFGSLTRYLFSILFNTNPKFPLGTLLSNTLGSLLYFGIIAIQTYVHKSSSLIKQILISIIQGYCGCLTTVSTLIVELNTIEKRKYVYIYFILTVFPVQILFIIFGDIFSSLCSPSS